MAIGEAGRTGPAAVNRFVAVIAAAGCIVVLGAAFLDQPAWIVAAIGVVVLGIVAVGALIRREPDAASGAARDAAAAPRLSELTRDVLEALHDPVVVLDGAGRVVIANRATQALMGANVERKHISALMRAPQLLEAVDRVLGGAEPETVNFSFLVPVERHYEAYVASRGAGDSRVVLVQFHDFTAIRRAEQMRGDFIANASHELRTPLAAVSGFIDTLRGHAKDDAPARERFLEIMNEETERMRRLIDNLLSLTRIELNEHNAPTAAVDLASVARAAAAALAPLAEGNATVEIVASEPINAVGDRDELIQVFQNLIHNAIKYGRDKGRVVVSFGRVEGQGRASGSGFVFADVKDEGEGIPPDVIPRLTERFYRPDVKRAREKGGTGLGLAIVKHILNRHQGRLQIASEPGKGSTFTIFLPAAGA
jgi:two-component system, OmpR family, phosphate regulon sensor histidine kinase PhoR